ncbi:imelysin family protein [Persicitalea jodogahamensis]|uniref:Iron-regulated protein A n=1 Tax=Persicitalea jodogahamensis TaxID=402147 RepID=A0A8J3D4F4_9BACT|nr:imelysin family protein [Persicitalea jodogahamensis]GHB73440.1 iron-regulated protein A precursor [Persicitalea jodogahamensis]
MKFSRISLFCCLIAGSFQFGCTKNNGSTDPIATSNDTFKTGMLTNYADNLIIPAYGDLNAKLNTLETPLNAFLDQPTTTSLEAVKPAFKAAYVSYEATSVAYFGPAAALLSNNYLNTFPAVPGKIEKAISSGNYNFELPVVNDSIQGFPALEYLLFAPNSLEKFTGANASARKKYVRDVLSRIRLLTNNTLSQWNGAYRTTFVNSLKTDVGSSIAFLVNQFAYEMDALKGPRIGWPFGKLSNGQVFADKSEGYYSGLTRELAVANLTSLKNYFVGAKGDGIADYLVMLKKDALAQQVIAQFDVAIGAINAIPQPMTDSFSKNPAQVEEAYRQVQKLLTLIKTDVASATSVQITYQDNDGD